MRSGGGWPTAAVANIIYGRIGRFRMRNLVGIYPGSASHNCASRIRPPYIGRQYVPVLVIQTLPRRCDDTPGFGPRLRAPLSGMRSVRECLNRTSLGFGKNSVHTVTNCVRDTFTNLPLRVLYITALYLGVGMVLVDNTIGRIYIFCGTSNTIHHNNGRVSQLVYSVLIPISITTITPIRVCMSHIPLHF